MTRVDSFLPLFGRDFLASTMGWSAAERGHYAVLLIIQWEQGGLPPEVERLSLVSPGLSDCWGRLEGKFPVWDDGMRRNRRLEEHRAKSLALKRARSQAGAKGNAVRWGSQGESLDDRKATTERIATGSPPSPSPSPQEKKKSNSSISSGGLAAFPCDDGQWVPTNDMVAEWQETYADIDIAAQLRKARQWCVDNVDRRKTKRGMRRFIGSWLAEAERQTVEKKEKKTKEIASL